MKKNVLITGVAGLLGSRLADWIMSSPQPSQAFPSRRQIRATSSQSGNLGQR